MQQTISTWCKIEQWFQQVSIAFLECGDMSALSMCDMSAQSKTSKAFGVERTPESIHLTGAADEEKDR
jgi:hypothetical protein